MSSGAGNGSLTATTAMTYDTRGNVTAVDGPLAGTADTARAQYDLADQLLGTVSPDPDGAGALLPRATRYSYHPDGMVESVARGTVATTTSDVATISIAERVINTYDPAGRKVQENLYDAASTTQALTQYGYDGEGRLVCTAVRMNPATFGSPAGSCVLGTTGAFGPDRITRVTYDVADQVTKVETGVGTADQRDEVANTWSNNGRLLTVTDAKSNRTTYEYDGFDRLKKTRYPLPATINASSTTDYEELTYDFGSNVVSRRLRDGQVIGFTYDDLSRAVLKDLPGTEPDVIFAYDNLGRLTQARKAATSHTIGLAYDALGRQTSESSIFGSMTYQYDLAGRRTRVTWPDAFYVTYDYLTTGEATSVRENGGTALATYAYDNLGRRTGLTRSNGTSTSYAYDPVSRLSSLTQNLAGTANDITLSFTYNPASQIASNTRSNDLYAWTGHGSGTAPSTPNGLNQIVSHNGSTIGYDARGNLVNDGAFTYGYTSENLLVTRSGGAALIHDPLMRLYQTNADGNTWFTLDGAEIASEHNSVGLVKRRYVRGPGMDEPIVWYEGAGTSDRRFLHADERGSIIAVSDAAGNPIAINKYDEYGVPAPGNLGRFQYTGQAWMPEIGLYHYKARAYAPRLGRFMQTDPIGYGDGMNLYVYVGGDPVGLNDPTGTRRLTPGERALADAFIGSIPYDSVRLYEQSWRNGAFLIANRAGSAVAIGNEISFPSNLYAADFSVASTRARGLFLHEMVHVWQYNNRSYVPLLAGLEHIYKGNPYDYSIVAGKSFDDYGWEEQAQIIQDCYVNRSSPACDVRIPNETAAQLSGAFAVRVTPIGSRIPRYPQGGGPKGGKSGSKNVEPIKPKKKRK